MKLPRLRIKQYNGHASQKNYESFEYIYAGILIWVVFINGGAREFHALKRCKILAHFRWSYSCEVHHLLAGDLSGGSKKPGKLAISFPCCPHHLSSSSPAALCFHKSLFLSPQLISSAVESIGYQDWKLLFCGTLYIHFALGGPFLDATTSLKLTLLKVASPLVG